jgi:hypothetical protein
MVTFELPSPSCSHSLRRSWWESSSRRNSDRLACLWPTKHKWCELSDVHIWGYNLEHDLMLFISVITTISLVFIHENQLSFQLSRKKKCYDTKKRKISCYPFICKLVTLLLLRIGRLVPHCNHQGGPTLGNHPELETKQQVTSQYDPNRPVLAGPSPNRLVDQNSKTSQTSCICLPKQNDISFVISG